MADVAFVAASASRQDDLADNASPFSFSFASGTSDCVIVDIYNYTRSADLVSGVTFNGIAGFRIEYSQNDSAFGLYSYVIPNAGGGTHNVIVSKSGTAMLLCFARSYVNTNIAATDLNGIIDVHGKNFQTVATSPATVHKSLTSTIDKCLFAGVGAVRGGGNCDIDTSVNAGEVIRTNGGSGEALTGFDIGSVTTPAGAVDQGIKSTGGNFPAMELIVFAIKPPSLSSPSASPSASSSQSSSQSPSASSSTSSSKSPSQSSSQSPSASLSPSQSPSQSPSASLSSSSSPSSSPSASPSGSSSASTSASTSESGSPSSSPSASTSHSSSQSASRSASTSGSSSPSAGGEDATPDVEVIVAAPFEIRPLDLVTQDPEDERLYRFNFDREDLPDGVTLDTFEVSATAIAPSDADVPALSDEEKSVNDRCVDVLITSAPAPRGSKHRIRCKATTNENPAQIKTKSFILLIEQG